jgi:Ca-activated chloride channel family protein
VRAGVSSAVVAIVVLVVAGSAAAGDRTLPPAGPVFSTGAELVKVTVTVRDHDGALVPNLSADDFVVTEDGRRQKIQLFAPAVVPGHDDALTLDLGLLLDTSQSMAPEIRLSQEAATRFLEAIPRARDLLTVFFDADIRISHYDSEHQQGLFGRILDARASGTTALYDAIAVYLSRVQDTTGRKVLVLLSDGEDTRSELSLDEVSLLVRSSAVTIYSIAFPGDSSSGSSRATRARAFLAFLADQTGGQVFHPRGSKDLPEIYETILDELSSQYVLGFTSDAAKRDGKFRKLHVEVKPKDLKLRYRNGYFGPKG